MNLLVVILHTAIVQRQHSVGDDVSQSSDTLIQLLVDEDLLVGLDDQRMEELIRRRSSASGVPATHLKTVPIVSQRFVLVCV